jgi:hypothetical protein
MHDRIIPWFPVVLIVAVLLHAVWRYHTARGIAEEWLTAHRYRTRSLRMGWFGFGRFAPKFFRDEGRAYQFRAEVDDMRLGGTGVVWLRVWTDRLGLANREPEVRWERMPIEVAERSETMETTLAEAQLALLTRVVAGEPTLRGRSHSVDEEADFDEVVEHVMALVRRGLVTCDAPLLNVHGNAQYAAVTNVALTDLGRRLLAERPPERQS